MTALSAAVDQFGVRGVARGLGVSPAYVSMLGRGKRSLTPQLDSALEGLVNTSSVNKPVNKPDSPYSSSASLRGGNDKIRTCDLALMKRPLCR